MSGSSMNYACYRMERGELDRFHTNIERMIEVIGLVIKYAQENKESELAIAALSSERAKLEQAQQQFTGLEKLAVELHEIAHDLEWLDSGDYGKDCVVENSLERFRKRNGI